MKTYSDIFFDLDHTLWDFDRNSSETLRELFNELNLPDIGISSVDQFIHEYKLVNEYLWEQFRKRRIDKEELRISRFEITLSKFGISQTSKLAETLASEYIRRAPFKSFLFVDAMEILNYLKKRYRLHIITNGFPLVQRQKLRSSGIESYFENIFISEEVGWIKPERQIFEFALSNSNASAAQSIMIGDNLQTDIIGAQQVEMDTVFFNPEKKAHNVPVTFEIKGLSELSGFL